MKFRTKNLASEHGAYKIAGTPKNYSTKSSVESKGMGAATDRKMKVGLTVVVVPNHHQPGDSPTGELRLGIEQDILRGDQRIGIGCSSSKLIKLLWAGSDEEIRAVQGRNRHERIRGTSELSTLKIGEYECDWLCGAGYNAIDRHLDEQTGLLTFFYSVSTEITPIAAANLGKLRSKAKSVGCHVVMFLVVEPQFEPKALIGMTDKVIVIKTCEADPDQQWAFSVEHICQGHFSTARCKLMGQMSLTDEGLTVVSFTPYLHDMVSTRVQWHMNRHGAINKDIGIAFDINGSTVYRSLQNLPKNMPSWLTKNELDRLLSLILGDEPPTKSMKITTDLHEQIDTDSDDEFDWDDDDEDEDEDNVQVSKKQPKRGKTTF